jgi:hypothetical protein
MPGESMSGMVQRFINVAIKHCHINKIFYSRFARPLRGNRKTWQLLLRQVHVFQIGKEIFTCRSNKSLEITGKTPEFGLIFQLEPSHPTIKRPLYYRTKAQKRKE